MPGRRPACLLTLALLPVAVLSFLLCVGLPFQGALESVGGTAEQYFEEVGPELRWGLARGAKAGADPRNVLRYSDVYRWPVLAAAALYLLWWRELRERGAGKSPGVLIPAFLPTTTGLVLAPVLVKRHFAALAEAGLASNTLMGHAMGESLAVVFLGVYLTALLVVVVLVAPSPRTPDTVERAPEDSQTRSRG